MIARTPFLICLLLAITLFCGFSTSIADQSNDKETSYVLLQNGRVLIGRLSYQKDKVTIAVADNSSIMIDAKQIAFVGKSIESLYDNQRASVRNWGTGEHWHLAYWCIQYGLLDKAIEHYEYLELHAADSPRFKQLEHLMRDALLADEKIKRALQGASSAPTSSDLVQPSVHDSAVVLASAESPKRETISGAAPEAREQEVDPWAKHEIPGYIRQTFHKSILPILITRCGQSGCHGLMGKSDFHIYQPVGDQSALVLAKDLDAVLKYINRENVQASPLMAYATKPHGIQKNPSFNQARQDDRALIERINQWIKSLAFSKKLETTMPTQYPLGVTTGERMPQGGVSQAVAVTAANETEAKPKKGMGRAFEKAIDVQDRKAKLSKPAKSAPPTVFLTGGEITDLESAIAELEKRTGSEAAVAPNAKKDPFDPDVFNRKFR
jgi:hypothetical protein